MGKKFELGQVVATPGALEAIEKAGQTQLSFLLRHAACDWGDVCEEDAGFNDQSLKDGTRLLSAYKTTDGTKLWVITEAVDDAGRRSATTILLPEEY